MTMKTLIVFSIISGLSYVALMMSKEQRRFIKDNNCSLYLTKKSDSRFVNKQNNKKESTTNRLNGYTDFSGGTWGI